jgi:cold shock CspA family protein
MSTVPSNLETDAVALPRVFLAGADADCIAQNVYVLDVTLPGHELTVNRVEHEDVYVALREAFDDMRRQVEDTVRLLRGQEKQHPVPLHGEVVRFDAEGRFGFIRTGDGDEYWFSAENVVNEPFESMPAGTQVQFIPEVAGEGRQAKRVSVGRHSFG